MGPLLTTFKSSVDFIGMCGSEAHQPEKKDQKERYSRILH